MEVIQSIIYVNFAMCAKKKCNVNIRPVSFNPRSIPIIYLGKNYSNLSLTTDIYIFEIWQNAGFTIKFNNRVDAYFVFEKSGFR